MASISYFTCFVLLPILLAPDLKQANTPRNVPVAGAVRLQNGFVLEGMCSLVDSLDPERDPERRLELRRIHQGFRVYDVATRSSDAVVPDSGAVPFLNFTIPRRRGRRKMFEVIGVPQMSPLSPDGTATVKLHLPGDRVEEIQVAVARIDHRAVQMVSTTHQWNFGMSTSSIPDEVLYPGLLERADGFSSGDVQLTMVEMLTKAGHVRAARRLLQHIQSEFPNLQQQVTRAGDTLQQETARRILDELQLRHDHGQTRLISSLARRFPDSDLTPAARVSVQKLVQDHEQQQRRVNAALAALSLTLKDISSDERRSQAREMVSALSRELDPGGIDRLAAWELLADDESLAVDTRLALAVSGWMLGDGEAIQGFAETWGLFRIRQLIAELAEGGEADSAAAQELIEEIRQQEGFTVARVARLLRHMPPLSPLRVTPDDQGRLRVRLTAETSGLNAVGQLPPDYSPHRRYPLLLAIPRQGVSVEDTLDWWGTQAARHGYLLVVPEVIPTASESYPADADTHQRVQSLLRDVKLGLSVDDNRVYVAGHGVGGDIAMDLATCHPDQFAAVVSVAGLGRRALLSTAWNSIDLGWYVVVGDRQRNWYARLNPVLKKLFGRPPDVGGRIEAVLVRYPGRGFDAFYEETPQIFRWLQTQVRDPWPLEIQSHLMRSSDLSWHWLQFDSLPDRFQALEKPTQTSDPVAKYGRLKARILPRNAIHIRTAPSGGSVFLSPEMPNLNLSEPIRIDAVGHRIRVRFEPSVEDLLRTCLQTGERERLCHQRVRFDR